MSTSAALLPNTHRLPRQRRTALAAVALLVATGLGWWALQGRAATPPDRPDRPARPALRTPVVVGAVQQQDMPVTVSALGTITAANTAVVRARVSGPLLALKFREGQRVQAGQVLALIDPEPLRIVLAQADATLARDQALLGNARADLTRYQGLVAQEAVPRQTLDTQVATVRQLEATVQADQAARSSAALQLSYTTVTAPISGLAGLKQADLGNTVNPTDANGIVSIAQMQPAAVVFSLPAEHLAALRDLQARGQPMAVQAWDRAAGRRLAQGQVASIDNAIDTATGTVKVKALFPNADGALFANQPVSVSLQLGSLPQALAVPSAALLRGTNGAYVFEVLEGAKVAMRPVKLLASDGMQSAVQGDLHAGSRVVVDGTDRLRDGAAVEVIDRADRRPDLAASDAARGHRARRDAGARE